AAVPPVLGEVQAEPGPGHRPGGPAGLAAALADGGGDVPEVGVVVAGPAARSVDVAGGLAAGLGEFGDEAQQRLVALGEVAALGRPVVHLHIDVGGEVAVPG